MPVLDVEIVTRPGEQLPPALAKELADAAGLIFGSEPTGTWVRLQTIPSERYAEGPGDAPPVFPVFVSVLKAQIPAADAMQLEVARLSEVVAQFCQRPVQNIHILYLPDGRGRVAFGGTLLRS